MVPIHALKKPKFGEPCSGCAYCCTAEPCALAQQFLNCRAGPCVALEVREGQSICGLARNPLGYLYQAAHPDECVPVLDPAPAVAASQDLSAQVAAALGFGKGCDAEDDADSEAWNALVGLRGAPAP